MKTMKYHIPFFTCLLLSIALNAQVVIDPVKKVYKIGGSSEIFISYTNKDGTHAKQGVLDVPPTLDDATHVEESFETGYLDKRKTASATADFNGDGADEVVTVTFDNEYGVIKISIFRIGEDLIMNELKEYVDTSLNAQNYTRIRMIAGNFDEDPQDEFAICYDLPDGTMTITLFKTDSNLNIEQIASFKGDISYISQIGAGTGGVEVGIVYYDNNFDIAAGDVDGDGIDEILMVRNKEKPYRKSGPDPTVIVSKYDLYILKYDKVAMELTMQQKREFELENQIPEHNYYPDRGSIINEMRISCGDMNNDGRDEVVVGWSFYYCYYRELDVCVDRVLGVCVKYESYHYFQNMTFLNTFKLTGDNIENYQNIYMPRDYFGKRGVSADQHIAMTLKCEQMDNLGRSKVLVNSASKIYVFGMGDDDMGLKFIGHIPSNGDLNIQGNETFAVADLNPDTTALNFNKEVIILQSDNTPLQQISTRYNGKTSMTIASIDKITSDTIVFKTPGPALDIPFSSSENIEISAFLAGDFDLNDAEVYFVGPPVITPVSDLQQPIVILNSPPVHFDVLDGEIFDICNAFTGDPPSFSATYKATIGSNETTSVMIDNGYGFTTDIRGYAMAGGNGFEAALKTNWEKGRSFYNANIQNKTIEQTQNVYREDLVLRSSLDYSYHKYPVFDRKGEKLGVIAVLNPVSTDFTPAWESANSWTHPSYVFNHEPGNILSYKQKKKSTDFSVRPSDFIFHEYWSVPVSAEADGGFRFTFDNISSEGNSYSYSGGVGADLFTKIGIETTVTASLAPLGLGGSVASDVRIGVSSDISAWYHNSTLSTHSTELRNSFEIEGTIGLLAKRYDDMFRYQITPYIYRSQSGALVLDYIVKPDGDNYWWKRYYGEKPDLAFILPWRYATEKGSENVRVSRKQKTSDIQFYQPIVNPGDTVIIITRVHNFSLMPFDDLLKVDYYLGDPVDGGVKLTDIYGETGSSKYSTMIYGAEDNPDMDREEYLTFIWEVPDTVSCSPRIYAVIDPENVYTEIHKNNNVGWNLLNIYDCEECKYVERITQTGNFFSAQAYAKAYPNPFSSYCQIRFSLPQPESVQIDLYNLAGHKMVTLAEESYGSGEHEISLNAANLGEGIYFCKITAGKYSEMIKLVLIR